MATLRTQGARSRGAAKHDHKPKRAPHVAPKASRPHAERPSKTKAKAKSRARAPSADRGRAAQLLARLAETLPTPRCELEHDNAWQLLVATILSAQSTDARVNQVTPVLFARFPTPAALGAAELPEVEQLIHSTGFFRNKAKAVVAASRIIADEHAGVVPRDIDALLRLPGVARKTANVVLGTAYRVPSGIVVDTHAGRVSRRLGFSAEQDPSKVERDLCALVPQSEWIDTGHRLVLHGRYVRRATSPDCGCCPLQELCPSAEHVALGSVQERITRERARIAARGLQGP